MIDFFGFDFDFIAFLFIFSLTSYMLQIYFGVRTQPCFLHYYKIDYKFWKMFWL
jgi:hypothetical protein